MNNLADLLVSYNQVKIPKSVINSNFNNFQNNYRTTSNSSTNQNNSDEIEFKWNYNKPEFKWNYDGLNTTSSVPSIPGINLQTQNISSQLNSDIKNVMNYFVNKGLTAEQASGFVGNFLIESNLNTSAEKQDEKKKGYKGYGRGIAQWSNERIKKFEKFSGKKIEDASLVEQLDFVWHELNQRPELLRQLRSAKTSDESANLIYRGYENGSNTSLATPEQLTEIYSKSWKKLGYREYNYQENLRLRQNKAKQALNIYNS